MRASRLPPRTRAETPEWLFYGDNPAIRPFWEVVPMLIDDIVPYERNARHNEQAVPVVADSIREFGLRGQIVLESRDNPVIVAGHT